MKVLIQARIDDETFELGSTELDTPDSPKLAELLRRIADEMDHPLAFTQAGRPDQTATPCSPEWEPSAVFPVGPLKAVHSWRCACGAEPTFGSVFADPANARRDFVAHVLRGREQP